MVKQKSTFEKRSRELAKQQKRKEKSDRRSNRKKEKETDADQERTDDPDLAGIVPGPQIVINDSL